MSTRLDKIKNFQLVLQVGGVGEWVQSRGRWLVARNHPKAFLVGASPSKVPLCREFSQPTSVDYMTAIVIDSITAYEQTKQEIARLLNEPESANKAVELAESLVAGTGQEVNVTQLRAYTYADAGLKLKDSLLMEKGAAAFRTLESHSSATVSYNLASIHLQLWQLAVEQAGLGDAWLTKRCHLQEARRLFDLVVQNKEADTELRLKALTDCGNSFDIVGRYLDALDCYERALKLDSSFGMAAGNRGITRLNVAPLMGGHESHVLLEAVSDLDIAISDQARVLRCGGQSALETFKRQRSGLLVNEDSHYSATGPSPQLGDPHLDWCLHNQLFLHIAPDCIRAGSETFDAVTFKSISLSLSEGTVLDRANEIVDAFNTIKQDYIVARYLVWLAAANDSPIQGQAKTITRRISFWDSLNYAYWGVRPGIGIQGLKGALDTLDTIAAFVHLYFRSGRGVRDIEFRTLPYANRSKKKLAPSLAEALTRPEQNRGLAALFDLSAELDEQSTSPLRRLVQRRHAATHRFFSVHIEGTPDSSDWMERLSWPELFKESLESLQITRRAILYLAQMIHIHEKATHESDSPGSMTMPMPFERTDADLMEPG